MGDGEPEQEDQKTAHDPNQLHPARREKAENGIDEEVQHHFLR